MFRTVLGVSCSLIVLAGCHGNTAKDPDGLDASGPASDGSPAPEDGSPPPPPDGAADGGACPIDPASGTGGSPRHTIPWTFVPGGSLAADAGAGAPADGGATAGCTGTLTYPSIVTCRATVTIRKTGAGDLDLVFADGSILAWSGESVVPQVPYPYLLLNGPQTAWADYSRVDTVICPVCGGYRTTMLEIRTSATGPVLWVGREGARVGDLSTQAAQELFGVGVRQQLECQVNLAAACETFTRSVFDHVVETTPEQLVASFIYRNITTPNGDFAVLWGASAETNFQHNTGCSDDPGVGSDTGFAIARTSALPSNQY